MKPSNRSKILAVGMAGLLTTTSELPTAVANPTTIVVVWNATNWDRLVEAIASRSGSFCVTGPNSKSTASFSALQKSSSRSFVPSNWYGFSCSQGVQVPTGKFTAHWVVDAERGKVAKRIDDNFTEITVDARLALHENDEIRNAYIAEVLRDAKGPSSCGGKCNAYHRAWVRIDRSREIALRNLDYLQLTDGVWQNSGEPLDVLLRAQRACEPIGPSLSVCGIDQGPGWYLQKGSVKLLLDSGTLSAWRPPDGCKFGPPFQGTGFEELEIDASMRILNERSGAQIAPTFSAHGCQFAGSYVRKTEPVPLNSAAFPSWLQIDVDPALRTFAFPAPRQRIGEVLQLVKVTEFERKVGSAISFSAINTFLQMRPEAQRVFAFESGCTASTDPDPTKCWITPSEKVKLLSRIAWQQ